MLDAVGLLVSHTAQCRIKRLIQQTIGVYSGRGLAATLREKCPEFFFADAGVERDSSRIALIDRDWTAGSDGSPRKSVVRILLGSGPDRSPRKPGDGTLRPVSMKR